MANSSNKHTLSIVPSASSTSQYHTDTAEQIKAQVTMALSTLDTLYKENINSYAQELHEYTRKIENVKGRIKLLIKEKEPHEKRLLLIQKEIDYELRLLERLTEEWSQKSIVICELEKELSQLDHSVQKRKDILKNRNVTLEKLSLEIEDIELSLLEHELEKQNLLLIIEPIEREINTLTQTKKELESQKHYMESSHLHHLTPSLQTSPKTLIEKPHSDTE